MSLSFEFVFLHGTYIGLKHDFLQTLQVIENFKRSSEQMVAGANPQRQGSGRIASDSDTLLRVLCHRVDQNASKFLKKQYKLSST